jgi:peptidoglycan/xylan/chitin deacetylase (PgdA/CDA1 family)
MLASAKSLVRRTGLNRQHIAAARMLFERHALAAVNSTRKRAGGRILCYHSIDEPEMGVNDVSARHFRNQIEFALACGYRFVPASQIAKDGGVERDLAVTFDDGRISVATRAAPILKKYGIPWSLFVVTTWSNHTNDWSRSRIVSWKDIERLISDGVEIGSHSLTHPDFGKIGVQQMADELTESRATIEKRLGFSPLSFAIPYGQSMNWPDTASSLARDAGYEVVYAQAEETRPTNTIPRTFVTKYDGRRIFSALLSGAYDRWEEWL